MAGTVTVTTNSRRPGARQPIQTVTLAWTSDASGDVNGTATGYLSGAIERVTFVPGAGGTQPSDNYDVSLRVFEGDGIDLLAAQGQNRSQTTASQIKPGVPFKDGTTTSLASVVVDDILELVVAAAGNAKTGTVAIYLR